MFVCVHHEYSRSCAIFRRIKIVGCGGNWGCISWRLDDSVQEEYISLFFYVVMDSPRSLNDLDFMNDVLSSAIHVSSKLNKLFDFFTCFAIRKRRNMLHMCSFTLTVVCQDDTCEL